MHAKNVPFIVGRVFENSNAYNRIPQTKLGFILLYKKLSKIKPVWVILELSAVYAMSLFIKTGLQVEKRALRCIFVGYDTDREGWRFCDPPAYWRCTPLDVVIDGTSSWWSSEVTVLLSSNDLQDNLYQQLNAEHDSQKSEHQVSPINSPSLWKIGAHYPLTPEEGRLS